MSARQCFERKIAAGRVSADVGAQILDLFDEIRAEKVAHMGADAADGEAALDAAKAAAREAARKRDLRRREVIAQARIGDALRADPAKMYDAAIGVLVQADNQTHVVRANAQALFGDAIAAMRTKGLRFRRDKLKTRAIVKALFGEKASEEAKDFARAWDETSEYLRKRANAAGMDIAKRDDWRLPQSHDSRAVAEAGRQAWKEAITPSLAPDRMVDPITGETGVSAARLDEMLDHVFDTVSTDGLNKIDPGRMSGAGRKLANQRQEHRTLVFRDADAWLGYHERFGGHGGDAFASLIDHIDRLSHDIGLLETLGPNPETMRRFMTDTLRVRDLDAGAQLDAATQATKGQINRFEHTFDQLTGVTETPINARFANRAAALRQGLVAAQLGGAFLSSFNDLFTNGLTAVMNDLSVTRIAKDVAGMMVSERDGKAAIAHGLIADGWAQVAGQAYRYTGEHFRRGTMATVADGVMRLSLLKPWTEANQWAFGKEFVTSLGRLADRELVDLPDGMRGTFERYGVTPEQWDAVRKSGLDDWNGAASINLAKAARSGDQDAASALHRMIVSERDLAVISPNVRDRARLRMGTQPGTILGEIDRALTLYKTFPVTFMMKHAERMAAMRSIDGRIGYGLSLFVGMTALGASSMMAKDIAKGRDPRSMDSWEAWVAAAAQGGGLGILGDFLFEDQSRAGHSLATTAAGPVVGLGADITQLTIGQAQRAVRGDDVTIGGDAVRFAQRYTPGASMWWGRLVLERTLWDQLSLMVDPKAAKRMRRMEKRAKRDYGQRFFWSPGEVAPDRAPDLGAAAGG